MPKMRRIYLAAPYWHEDQKVRAERVDMCDEAAAAILQTGANVFSPLTHSHRLVPYLPDERLRDHDFWLKVDLDWLRECDELWVLRLPGWARSRGVDAEIQFARENNIPAWLIRVDDGSIIKTHWLGDRETRFGREVEK